MSYTSVTVTPTIGGIVPTLTFDVCDTCGSIVGDTEIHDRFHTGLEYVSLNARQAVGRAYDYTPFGR